MTQEDESLLIKDYRGFTITGNQYVEKPHPQYNYLGFKAENNIGQHIEVTFHDIDMRCKTYDELLDIFLKRVDQFINEINKEMKQEDKNLLLKDLCMRLPYGVIMTNKMLTETYYPLDGNEWQQAYYDDDWDDVPYLRSMSSMTEEEKKELLQISNFDSDVDDIYDNFICGIERTSIDIADIANFISWLNKNHFDYRGLIEKGLAIEVTEENNPYND